MKIAWVFPGQGSQSVGMGRALYDSSAAAREVFARADAALERPISPVCFDGPAEALAATENTQPAILTTSVAAVAALREAAEDVPPPALAAGHSLGEYTALVASGGLALEDAVRIVRLRGRAMQEAVPVGKGAMVAILGAGEDVVLDLCRRAREGGVVSPANYNAPGQIVVAGDAIAVARASELAKARGLKTIPLNVSAPFHCSLMAPAAAVLDRALRGLRPAPMSFPVVANVDAAPNSDPSKIRSLLVRQVDHPVLWEQCMRRLASEGVTHVLELGAGRVLAGLLRKIDHDITVASVGDPKGLGRALQLIRGDKE